MHFEVQALGAQQHTFLLENAVFGLKTSAKISEDLLQNAVFSLKSCAKDLFSVIIIVKERINCAFCWWRAKKHFLPRAQGIPHYKRYATQWEK